MYFVHCVEVLLRKTSYRLFFVKECSQAALRLVLEFYGNAVKLR